MKFLFSVAVLCSLMVSSAFSQKPESKRLIGSWLGKIDLVNTQQLRVIFNFKAVGDSLLVTLDSPDQAVKDIPVKKGWMIGDSVFINASLVNGHFKGLMLNGDTAIDGFWSQGSFNTVLFLNKLVGPFVLKRPQEPHAPFPYKSEDLVFLNKTAGVELSGTLTIPEGKGPFPALVLVTGSGPQNRNEELFGHKPFWVIADFLTRNGIAVLRYDDRGTYKSKGNFKSATTFDFADDAEAGFNYLLTRSEIDPAKVGIAGHSEGAMIAPLIAARNKKVSFIIMLAGPGLTGRQVLLRQTSLISRSFGMPEGKIDTANMINNKIYDIVEAEPDSLIAAQKIRQVLLESIEQSNDLSKEDKDKGVKNIDQTIKTIDRKWFRTFLTFNPVTYLSKVQCPVLALNGANDIQVSPDENLNAILDIMEKTGNKFYQIKKLPELNHLFQHSKTGLPSEYNHIEESFAPEALQIILEWLKRITG
jgi:pimeloyl-ACP methyl ester carboxylesterase